MPNFLFEKLAPAPISKIKVTVENIFGRGQLLNLFIQALPIEIRSASLMCIRFAYSEVFKATVITILTL